ncbi:MAG: hypothetical protein QOI54_151 [Actinomycetota bacterium]|nr:hypothetical protein [Actinomycetota bacterium]
MTGDLTPDEARDLRVMAYQRRMVTGSAFILDQPLGTSPVWGQGSEVLWGDEEGLVLTGTPGVGKTTLAQQIVKARMGLQSDVLGYKVEPTGSRVLYLAMDRPRQIARSFRRMVNERDRDLLAERLAIWAGPPPMDIAHQTDTLMDLALAAGADTVVIDSLKDAALGLVTDEVGAAVNRAIQTCLTAHVNVLTLHHQTKRSGSGDGSKPISLADVYGSGWITAGAGSVVLLHGDAGARRVALHHLKPVADEVGPLTVEHNHYAGVSRLADDNVDPLLWLRCQREPVTVQHLAQALAGATRSASGAGSGPTTGATWAWSNRTCRRPWTGWCSPCGPSSTGHRGSVRPRPLAGTDSRPTGVPTCRRDVLSGVPPSVGSVRLVRRPPWVTESPRCLLRPLGVLSRPAPLSPSRRRGSRRSRCGPTPAGRSPRRAASRSAEPPGQGARPSDRPRPGGRSATGESRP